VQHSLLSASVFADDCTTADGWATAFMVMGLEKATEKLKSLENIDVIFIYSTENGGLATYVSPRIVNQVVLE
jgi:thiamine biosynthesis lipoprotein